MTHEQLYRRFALILASLLGIYLTLRAILNEPLHDELATYFFYIYQGDYFGKDMVVDANNHLLNSIIGHFIYPWAGDQFFWYRLPSLLCFGLYFYASYQLSKTFVKPSVRLLNLLALNSIPMIMEYFAYTRGYGISLGFFLFGIWHFSLFLKNSRLLNLILCFVAFDIAIAANLTLLQTSGILAVCALLVIWQKRNLGWKFIMVASLVVLLFFISLIPGTLFGFYLKDAGALYYGSLKGLWLETGRSLTGYILFNDGWLAAGIVFVLFALIALGLIRKVKNSNPFLQFDLQWLWYVLLFGNLAAILFLAVVLKVNYPADRTAFPLVLFFLFSLSHYFDTEKTVLGKINWLYLYFPCSFVACMTLHSSVFSPDDRMTNQFYKEVKPHINSNTSLMIYGIMRWSWPWHESHQREKAPMYNSYNTNQTFADIIVTKTNYLFNPELFTLYDTIAINPGSKHIAFKRKSFMQRTLELESDTVQGGGNIEYFSLWETSSLPKDRERPHLVTVKGHLKTFSEQNKIQLIMAIADMNGQLTNYEFYPFEYAYQRQKIDDDFTHHYILPDIPKNAHTLKVYFWSRQNDRVEVKNAKCYLYSLKDKNNGSR